MTESSLFVNPSAQVTTTRQYRVMFTDGAWIDFSPGPEFNFVQFITQCRSVGFMLTENAYIRWDLVRCVLMWQNGNPPAVPAPWAPTTQTKQ